MACSSSRAFYISGSPAYCRTSSPPRACSTKILKRSSSLRISSWLSSQAQRSSTQSVSQAASALSYCFTPPDVERQMEKGVRVDWAVHASDEDFETEEMIEFDDDDKDDEEEDLKDFETDYDLGRFGEQDKYQEADSFISTLGGAAESIVGYKINEDEFHKLSLQHCDFFIRKVPDVDDNVYDFREMYVTAPDTDIYAIPRTDEKLPKKPVRLKMSKHEHFCTQELPVEALRSPMVKNEWQVMKIFLMKHYKNRRESAPNFVLDFEQIYVIDSKTKSISRAKVMLKLPIGVDRDRSKEVLLVHDDGSTFSIVPQSEQKTASQVILDKQWNKSKKDLQNYLKSFRDYPMSNWF